MSNFNTIPSESVVRSTVTEMQARGFTVEHVKTSSEALEKLKSLIPDGAEVMTGSSTTLNQIGFTEYLTSGEHTWTNLGAGVWAENDEKKRGALRRQATTAEYMVASVNAVTQSGQLVAVDATGSRVSAYPFSAEHLILVVGAQKITKDLEEAMLRIREYVFPKEDARAQEAYGIHSSFGKWVIIEREFTAGRITMILVEEDLGY